MLSVADFKLSISSIEFSLFFQENCVICPNCGTQLESNLINEGFYYSLNILIDWFVFTFNFNIFELFIAIHRIFNRLKTY